MLWLDSLRRRFGLIRPTRKRTRLRTVPRVEELEHRALLSAEIEPNDISSQATGFPADDTLTGSITGRNDVDQFSCFLAQGDTIHIHPSNSPGNPTNPSYDPGSPASAPTVDFLDANGVVLVHSPDGRGLDYTVPSDGTYFISLTADNAYAYITGNYIISVVTDPFAGITEAENNDSAAAANDLGGSTNFRGDLGFGDEDNFSFNVPAGRAVAVKFADIPAENPSIRLHDINGNLLATSLNGRGLNAVLPDAGTYTISVRGDNLAGTVAGQYVGQLVFGDQPTPENATAESLNDAAVVDLGPYVVSGSYLFADEGLATPGLVGSYVDRSLRGESAQDDWRITQPIAGVRTDPVIHFPQNGWGFRSDVNLTRGNDDNWDEYSVQWDGYLAVVTDGTRVSIASDDGGRLWIDLNGDGNFDSGGQELVNNNWGNGQGTTLSGSTVPLAAGLYKIRMQYEEGGGDNTAYLLWDDAAHSAGSVVRDIHRAAVGTLSSISDVDVFALDLTATGFYEFRLGNPAGSVGTQGRLLTLFNQFGQPLEQSWDGIISTDRYHYRPEETARYYLAVEATDAVGLGSYAITTTIQHEFPTYRDIPLFFQDYTGYARQEQIPAFLAFFEARFDPYQIDLTQSDPGTSREHVKWVFRTSAPSNGAGGAAGGGFGTRSASGAGGGDTGVDWPQLHDVWFGLFYHENGHGVGLPHDRHPLSTMNYGGQVDYLPVGTSTRLGGDPWYPNPKIQNEWKYLDWTLESGRVLLEGEGNDTFATAQVLDAYFAQMGGDSDPRNDQAVVAGSIATLGDVDLYRLTVAAGETLAFDIDAAEFQMPLDARLELLDSNGNVLASNDGALDRDSGIASVDPYITYQFGSSGSMYVRVTSEHGTTGNYRLKATPERAFDRDGPRVAAAWPNGGISIDSTTTLTFWMNDQLDPATFTANNIIVNGAATGIHSGTAVFDPIDCTLAWRADSPLAPDSYTVTLRSGNAGITDLRGNPLDGETDGSLTFPEVSGDGNPGGDFTTSFTVAQSDSTPAAATSASYERHSHNRGMFLVHFDDELDVNSVYGANFTLRGAGPDGAFDTADDTFTLVDILSDRIHNTAFPQIFVYTRGVPDADNYRIEATFRDASGNTVNLAQVVAVTADVPEGFLFTDPSLTTPGLTGSYINGSLRGVDEPDWTQSQFIAGTRVDPTINFTSDDFGNRDQVNIFGGTSENWDDFSVQWDGYIAVPANGMRLATRSDDGSRLWIDLNGDGNFDSSGPELVNNNWGNGQGTTTGPFSVPLAAGVYKIRMQYEDEVGGNRMSLVCDYNGAGSSQDGRRNGLSVADVNVQPGSVLTNPPSTIDVTFSAAANPGTLTTGNFKIRYSPNSTFFDGNDTYLNEADGTIGYNASRHQASFRPSTPLQGGYYLIELNGHPGGITTAGGQLLDGEYLDANIAGYQPLIGWNDAPSGDGAAGGDYRAFFRVVQPGVIVTESSGTTVVEGGAGDGYTISLAVQPTGNVAITPSSNGQLTLDPPTLTFTPANWNIPQAVNVSAVDDGITEGDHSAAISHSAASGDARYQGIAIADVTVAISEELPGTLSLTIDPGTIAENAGTSAAFGTLTRNNADTSTDLFVTLSNSDASEVDVPFDVLIPAGQTSVTFPLDTVDDALLDGTQTVTIIAFAIGAGSASASVDVTDNETPVTPTLTLSFDRGSITENSGTNAASGTLRRNNADLTGDLLVTLNSNDTGEATVPATLLIPAGQAQASFPIAAVTDGLVDGTQTVTISATAPGFTAANRTIQVLDSDSPPTQERAIVALGFVDGSVQIVDGNTNEVLVQSFRPFDTPGNTYRALVSVTLGDVNGDGIADLFVAPTKRAGIAGLDPGKAGLVYVYNGADLANGIADASNILDTFAPFATNFDGTQQYETGFELATGDVNGDGVLDLVAASRGDVGQISVQSTAVGHAQIGGIVTPFGPNYRGKVSVTTGNFIDEAAPNDNDEIAAARGNTDAVLDASGRVVVPATSTRAAMYDFVEPFLRRVTMSGAINSVGVPEGIEGDQGQIIDRNAFVQAVDPGGTGVDLLVFTARDYVSDPANPRIRVAVFGIGSLGVANLQSVGTNGDAGSYLVGAQVGSYSITSSDINGDGHQVVAMAFDGPLADLLFLDPLTGTATGGLATSILGGGVRLVSV